jgi:hypothetical protein
MILTLPILILLKFLHYKKIQKKISSEDWFPMRQERLGFKSLLFLLLFQMKTTQPRLFL